MAVPPVPPHGGSLIDLLPSTERAGPLRHETQTLPSWDLTPRQLCDLELLACGAFSPLASFLGRADYESVCASMRLRSGLLWPIPVVLDLPAPFVESLEPCSSIVLRDPEGFPLAILRVLEAWRPDKDREADTVYGTTDRHHPGVAQLFETTHDTYVSGRLDVIQSPVHYDFMAYRLTPTQTLAAFARLGWQRVAAFQTRNPMHRAHYELTLRAAESARARLLIHPVVGPTKPGDVDYCTRVRCYLGLLRHYPANTAKLALLPLAMRMAGPREAVWHAIVRKNYGCTHFIVGRDHAGATSARTGRRFYPDYAAQELLQAHEEELGIRILAFPNMVWVEELNAYLPEGDVPAGATRLDLSGTDLRRLLASGRDIPSWFTFPEVARELQRTYPPRDRQGFTVLLTGLPSSGKSTIAKALAARLLERGGRAVTVLDGDIVRKMLSSELGFSRDHRDLNIRRIGFVAAEITRNGGIAICAPIAPYDAVRKEVRAAIEALGGFVLVHVSTPLETCESRDRKGLYRKARLGIVEGFTGISDPYETPVDADLAIDTTDMSPEECAQTVIRYLERHDYIRSRAEAAAASGDGAGDPAAGCRDVPSWT